jgi:predicted nucleic acid-binding protein
VLLLDNSAWSRVVAGGLPDDRAETVAGWLEQRQLAICLPFLLEAGYSARASADYQEMMDEFDLLFPRVEVAAAMEDRALLAQRELAARGHHRLAPIDVMVAACAHETGAGVLHYDRDYDLIAEHTSLSFESVWLAPAGTL